MTFQNVALSLLSVSIVGCTGAQFNAGNTPLEDALIVYWWCSADGELRSNWSITDSSGGVFWDPFDANTNEFHQDLYIPEGKVVVTIEKHSVNVSRQRIITHAFNSKCEIPFNGKYQSLDCSKDGFNVLATVDGWHTGQNAPVYKMPAAFTWSPGILGHVQPSSNMSFPAEWATSCKSTSAVGRTRRVINEKILIGNIR